MKNLKTEEIQTELSNRRLMDWAIVGKSLHKTFQFRDFVQALRFINKCGEEAENRNHHPDWRNVYNQIDVILNTHETGGITIKDLELAEFMNETFNSL